MEKHTKLLAIILGISCLCGCNKDFGVGKLNDATTEMRMEIDYNAVKDGYYLSDSGDGSYYLIKDGKYSLVGYDWEKEFRERNPRNEHSDMTDSEYEEYVGECVEDDIKNHTNKPFTPVKYEGLDIYVKLVTEPSPEDIASNGFNGTVIDPHMKDENTIGMEPPFYVYCGTSLPESIQTQPSD